MTELLGHVHISPGVTVVVDHLCLLMRKLSFNCPATCMITPCSEGEDLLYASIPI